MRKIMLTCDGAKYPSVQSVQKLLLDQQVTMVQTVPYSLEYSPVELFIKWLKAKI